MAYNNRNHLLTVKKVQDTYLQHKQEGISTMYVYRKFIYPTFLISRATFYIYLATPVNKRLKELAEGRPVSHLHQASLFAHSA